MDRKGAEQPRRVRVKGMNGGKAYLRVPREAGVDRKSVYFVRVKPSEVETVAASSDVIRIDPEDKVFVVRKNPADPTKLTERKTTFYKTLSRNRKHPL